MTEPARMNIKVIAALTTLHFLGDFYISFVNPLLPALADKFSLSLTQVGLIVGMMRMLAFIVQPPVGYFADRYRSRLFVLGGPLLCIVFIALMGWAPSYEALLMVVALGSIGAAMFHPSIAGMIGTYAGRHVGLSLAVFNTGGTLAFGLGPLAIAFLVERWGLEASLWTSLPGLLLLAFMFRVVPAPLGEGLRGQGFMGAVKEAFGPAWKPVLVIWIVMVLRAFVAHSFMAFLPIFYARQGHTLLAVGLVISLFTVAGAVSGVVAGHLSDRIGYRPLFVVSFLLGTPSLLLLPHLSGLLIYACSALAGALIYATLPLGLVMAQKLAPKGKSMVSSLMMGLAVGLGGMMTPLVGNAADLYSLTAALTAVAVVPVLSLGLVFFFPEKELRKLEVVA